MGPFYVYQVLNHDRNEMFFGTTDLELVKEMERVAKDRTGPVSHWQKGDRIEWRALTRGLDEQAARTLHAEFEKKPKPNKFKLIPTSQASDGT